jgi:hypothetical protein
MATEDHPLPVSQGNLVLPNQRVSQAARRPQ